MVHQIQLERHHRIKKKKKKEKSRTRQVEDREHVLHAYPCICSIDFFAPRSTMIPTVDTQLWNMPANDLLIPLSVFLTLWESNLPSFLHVCLFLFLYLNILLFLKEDWGKKVNWIYNLILVSFLQGLRLQIGHKLETSFFSTHFSNGHFVSLISSFS